MIPSDSRDPSLTRREFVQAAMVSGTAALLSAAEEKPPAAAPASDWPMYRHDPALTGVSPIKGGLKAAPSVDWSLDLGGPSVSLEHVVVCDVTGDGREDFLALSADAVVCRDSRGRLLWKLDDVLNPA